MWYIYIYMEWYGNLMHINKHSGATWSNKRCRDDPKPFMFHVGGGFWTSRTPCYFGLVQNATTVDFECIADVASGDHDPLGGNQQMSRWQYNNKLRLFRTQAVLKSTLKVYWGKIDRGSSNNSIFCKLPNCLLCVLRHRPTTTSSQARRLE